MANAAVAFDGWNASGVGWGDQPWGEGALDIAATGAVGAVTLPENSTVNLVGVAATAFVGQVETAANALVLVTGVEAVASVGQLVFVDAAVQVIGVQATGLVSSALVWGVINDSNAVTWNLVNDSNAVTWTTILT